MNVSVFITGSNSKVLYGDLSTYLAGRYINISIRMMSFTFFGIFRITKKPRNR